MSKNRVKAFVRFRPTDDFDHDSIDLLDDNQVNLMSHQQNVRFRNIHFLLIFLFYTFHIQSFIFLFDCNFVLIS